MKNIRFFFMVYVILVTLPANMYADDSIVLDMIMMDECAMQAPTFPGSAIIKKYGSRVIILGAVGGAYWYGRKNMRKEIIALQESLARIESKQHEHSGQLFTILKNQEGTTDQLHAMQKSQWRLHNKFDTHSKSMEEQFGQLHTHNKRTSTQMDGLQADMHTIQQGNKEDRTVLQTILNEVGAHRSESKQDNSAFIKDLHVLCESIKNRFV